MTGKNLKKFDSLNSEYEDFTVSEWCREVLLMKENENFRKSEPPTAVFIDVIDK